jgi:hypothetical protein
MARKNDKKEERYLLSYRFLGDTLPVNDLEKILNVKPREIGLLGEHPKNNKKYKAYDTNFWVSPIYRGYKPEDFYTEIELILNSFEKQEVYILNLVNNEDVEIIFKATLVGGPLKTELLLPSFWKLFDKYKIEFRLSSCV